MARQKYSWIPDLPDARDYKFDQFIAKPTKLPSSASIRDALERICDQGPLGSCTANSLNVHYDFARVKQGLSIINPSRLFIYYNERSIEGTVGFDSGAMLRDGIKSMANQGICGEKRWPYDLIRYRSKPSDKCYIVAKTYLIKEYLKLTLDDLKSCLALGHAFVFGFSVYDSFESDEVAQSGIVPIPDIKKESMLGGHAVCAVGYNDDPGHFEIRNSWGLDWGDQGHFYLPYEYFFDLHLCRDFWSIRLV